MVRIESIFLYYIMSQCRMLAHIPADVVHYCIAPYLHVSAAIVTAASADVSRVNRSGVATLLDQVQYTWPHGRVLSAHYAFVYMCNGKLHRTDRPARALRMINGKIRKEWYYHGVLHRVGGPAVDAGDSFHWFHYGKRHRTDGPASRYIAHGTGLYIEHYWYNDVQLSERAEFSHSDGGD